MQSKKWTNYFGHENCLKRPWMFLLSAVWTLLYLFKRKWCFCNKEFWNWWLFIGISWWKNTRSYRIKEIATKKLSRIVCVLLWNRWTENNMVWLTFWFNIVHRDAMLSAYAVMRCVCVCVCLLRSCILSKRVNISSKIFSPVVSSF